MVGSLEITLTVSFREVNKIRGGIKLTPPLFRDTNHYLDTTSKIWKKNGKFEKNPNIYCEI